MSTPLPYMEPECAIEANVDSRIVQAIFGGEHWNGKDCTRGVGLARFSEAKQTIQNHDALMFTPADMIIQTNWPHLPRIGCFTF